MSTSGTAPFAFDCAWRVHPKVAVRPERFGALLYHFDTRRLSFLKSPQLLAVLQHLDTAPNARTACKRAGLTDADMSRYGAALAALASTAMICERTP